MTNGVTKFQRWIIAWVGLANNLLTILSLGLINDKGWQLSVIAYYCKKNFEKNQK